MQFMLPELITDPYPHYSQWRENQPVWRDDESGMWVLTRHDDIRAILKDSAHYSSSAMAKGAPLPLLTDDPPRHTQLRGLVNKGIHHSHVKEH